MKIPKIKTALFLHLRKDTNSYKIFVKDTLSDVKILDENNLVIYVKPQFISSFIRSRKDSGFEIKEQRVTIRFNFDNKTQKKCFTNNFLNIYSDDVTAFKWDMIGPEVTSFFKNNDYFRVVGFVEPIQSNKRITLDAIYNNKSNDYSAYEALMNFFIKHDLNKEDFAEKKIQSLSIPTTIIIPVHNSEKTLDRVFFGLDNQILPQDYYNKVRLIIIDDNSDVPLKLGSIQYEFKNIKTIEILRSNIALFSGQARNLGYINLENTCVITMDSDILVESNFLINHIVRAHLYSNLLTTSTRENIDDSESFSIKNLEESYKNIIPSKEKDSRFKAAYPADYLGGPGYEFTIQPFAETDYFKHFGYGKSLQAGIELCLMVKTHNISTSSKLIKVSDYSGRFFKGWGEEDGYFGRKAIASGAFIVPVVSTGVYHFNHPPRIHSDETSKIDSLKKNIDRRKKKMIREFTYHIK